MGSCHNDSFLYSPITEQLMVFSQENREQWATGNEMRVVPEFDRFEQELHTLVMALERIGGPGIEPIRCHGASN